MGKNGARAAVHPGRNPRLRLALPLLAGRRVWRDWWWLRRWLSETPVFLALRERREGRAEFPLRTVLREHRRSLLPAALLTCVLTSAVVVFVVITPTVMQQRFGMTASHTFALSSVGIVFLNIGCVLAGLIVDRIGVWRSIVLYSLLLPLGIGLLYASLVGQWGLPGLAYAFAGLTCGIVGVVPSVMVGLFPAPIRVSGISFTYNIAYALWASTTPLLLIALMPWSPWVCVVFCAVMGMVGVWTARGYGFERGRERCRDDCWPMSSCRNHCPRE